MHRPTPTKTIEPGLPFRLVLPAHTHRQPGRIMSELFNRCSGTYLVVSPILLVSREALLALATFATVYKDHS